VTRIHEDKNRQLKPVNGLTELTKNESSKRMTPIKARVLYDYKPTATDELPLAVDDIVTILDKNLDDEGWWKVELKVHKNMFFLICFSPRVNLMDALAFFQVGVLIFYFYKKIIFINNR
jgi:hypothetical protein